VQSAAPRRLSTEKSRGVSSAFELASIRWSSTLVLERLESGPNRRFRNIQRSSDVAKRAATVVLKSHDDSQIGGVY
jgi:hypothetical protein